jgi:3-oxoacyl-[acyl-carrier-protein] synthase I
MEGFIRNIKQRVVVTGMGIHSCIGTSLEEVTASLRAGKSGIIFDEARKEFGYQSGLTGSVPLPDLKKELSRRERISMGEESYYAYAATMQALRQANICADFLNEREVGIIYGNDSTGQSVKEAADIMREKKDTALIGSGSIFKSMNSTITMNLSTILKLRGVNFTVSGACASGSHSIGLGFMMIQNGLQDCVICGGAQETNMFAFSSFDGLGVFAPDNQDPTKACRPFDADRNGLIPSGGGATLILESLDSALKRGANIIAEVLGYGFSSNGGHISTPNVDGPSAAMLRALQQSGVNFDEVKYVNAHATSTPVGDGNEAQAIAEVFGNHRPFVSSTKSMTGHECWMAGASETIYSILMMQNGFIAPNINFEKPDEQTEKINIVRKTQNIEFDLFLTNSFGFGGTNSALVIRKHEEK